MSKELNRAIVRRSPSGELILFFNDYEVNWGRINSWMEIGQHGEAHYFFYRLCKAVPDKEAEEFLELYHKTYNVQDKDRLSLRKRLNYSSLVKNW